MGIVHSSLHHLLQATSPSQLEGVGSEPFFTILNDPVGCFERRGMIDKRFPDDSVAWLWVEKTRAVLVVVCTQPEETLCAEVVLSTHNSCS